ncbi:MAG: class C beta-lactamase, partial [Comamonadaceae bacterium]
MIIQRLRTAFALTAAFVLAPAVAHDDTFRAHARAAYADAIVQYDIPGLVVGITHNGQHQFYATGLASRADNIAVTPDTLFELGSISKLFTVTLAALAEQRGQLSLDTKASHYLCADACTIGRDMTLMDLATHYSGGLPLQAPENIADTTTLIDWLKGWQPPQPGTRSYSNISIGLLGHITAETMGMPYAQALQTLLLPELGLTHTWVQVPDAQLPRYAYGYERKTDRPIRVSPGVLASEAYGLKSSARDMLRFLDVVLERGDVSPELKAAVRRTREGQLNTAKFTQD